MVVLLVEMPEHNEPECRRWSPISSLWGGMRVAGWLWGWWSMVQGRCLPLPPPPISAQIKVVPWDPLSSAIDVPTYDDIQDPPYSHPYSKTTSLLSYMCVKFKVCFIVLIFVIKIVYDECLVPNVIIYIKSNVCFLICLFVCRQNLRTSFLLNGKR